MPHIKITWPNPQDQTDCSANKCSTYIVLSSWQTFLQCRKKQLFGKMSSYRNSIRKNGYAIKGETAFHRLLQLGQRIIVMAASTVDGVHTVQCTTKGDSFYDYARGYTCIIMMEQPPSQLLY